MKNILLFTLLFILKCAANAQSLHFRPSFGVVLNEGSGEKLLKQCSRGVPKNIKNYWRPTQNDILLLENNFRNIYKTNASGCCVTEAKVHDLERFSFQYLGVVIKGKRFIYINAFPTSDVELYKELHTDIALTPIVVCDGGTHYWGALFDPATRQFDSLSFNGI